jgi:hypothetical protein
MLQRRIKLFGTVLYVLTLNNGLAQAQERIELEGTTVRGNRELPKVLYIVPWKSIQPIELDRPAFNSILDQSMQPVERSSFQRQVKYHQQLYQQQPVQP